MQWATRVNEAYRTLKSPVQRAKYLLEMNGVDVQFETNTQMPSAFLLQQLELREALAGAKQPEALDELLAEVRRQQRLLEQGVAQLIDGSKDYAAAAGEVRKLMFSLDKLAAQIDLAYDESNSGLAADFRAGQSAAPPPHRLRSASTWAPPFARGHRAQRRGDGAGGQQGRALLPSIVRYCPAGAPRSLRAQARQAEDPEEHHRLGERFMGRGLRTWRTPKHGLRLRRRAGHGAAAHRRGREEPVQVSARS